MGQAPQGIPPHGFSPHSYYRDLDLEPPAVRQFRAVRAWGREHNVLGLQGDIIGAFCLFFLLFAALFMGAILS